MLSLPFSPSCATELLIRSNTCRTFSANGLPLGDTALTQGNRGLLLWDIARVPPWVWLPSMDFLLKGYFFV